ncbi:MAG: calcium-translocating P-type ATPase, PMCA-type [Clostridium sp.]|uniref:calcium-translocating P-type ATPase, PMCA-type n=2 Tax=Clostridium sp. TaxID=1506 RepID=UPI00267169D2|nr:calcium-translocating P-type ATPase, PMCA-type [Clostridium sp.]MDD7683214.1 calcium-translocating P-type ATPase, PMCA-type [Clostridium sp.]MDY2578967.1 calcium-translocating P-type ATPase, PMCA-type [Clostridium sp.]
MEKLYGKDRKTILREFQTTEKGLSDNEVRNRKDIFGDNALKEKKRKGILKVFLNQFKDLLVGILIVAGIISIITDNVESTLVIFIVIFLNAILGTVQYFKAEQSLEALRSLTAAKCKVIRNGLKQEILSKDIVPGDILFLEAGDLIAADGRIIENHSLQVNESSLTGESLAVEKNAEVLSDDEIPLSDRKNMVFGGTLVTYGRAIAVVTSTGMNSELGKIANLMENTQAKETPLQKTLDKFSGKLAIIIITICIIVFVLEIYRDESILNALMFAVALAVAAIPEALSSIVTIVLALGTEKMAKENAIIKDLKAVEGLGAVSVICSDKTGTLTQNKMTVQKVYVDNKLIEGRELKKDNLAHRFLINNALLCNDSVTVEGKEIGDPTEVALVNLGEELHLDELVIREKYQRISEIPFDSDRKLMSTVNIVNNKQVLFTKGALDVLINKVNYVADSHGIRKLNDEERKEIISVNKQLSEQGLRILAFAYKELQDKEEITKEDENDYVFTGLISMIDPPRVESKDAVHKCIMAGIKPVMITGDHKVTAAAIAREIGIMGKDDIAVEGLEIDKLNDEQLKEKVKNISVYARVSPEHKIRIVRAWQSSGEIVAMTGDGVNDAPALKQADIGVAMGITGTEVSKDAASVILTDDNFSTIVKAVENGRNIYNNIKNSIKFLLSGNLSAIIAVLYCAIINLPMPFAAVHLLFINLLTDSMPAIAIGMEKSNGNLLKEKPRGRNESILNKELLKIVAFEGIIISIFTIISFYGGNPNLNPKAASTMAFSTLCLARLFHGFNCRGNQSIFKLGITTNIYSICAFLVGVLLLSTVLFIPPLKIVFNVVSLSGNQYLLLIFCAIMPTVIIQLLKIIVSYKK